MGKLLRFGERKEREREMEFLIFQPPILVLNSLVIVVDVVLIIGLVLAYGYAALRRDAGERVESVV